MTRFSAQIAVLLAVAGVSTAAGCELIVGGHHVPGTGGGSTTTSSTITTSSTGTSSSSSGTGGATGGSGGKSTGGSGGATGGSGGSGGTSTGGSGGTGGATGGSGGTGPTCTTMACTTANECPNPPNECVTRVCNMGCCDTTNVADLTPTVAGQTAADCQVVVCDGNGATKSVPDDMDPFDDGNDCTIDACSGGLVSNLPKAAGAACASNGGTMCDGNSTCVECLQNTDCTSPTASFCDPVQHKCVSPTCNDLSINGDETDVDCGGSCSTCGAGKACLIAADCTDGVCSGMICQAASCTDTIKNGTESDVDCGGTCVTKCGPGLLCKVDADCKGGSCSGTTCLPTCTDGVKNAAESDIDCGGATCAKCGTNKDCNSGSDCTSGVCTGNKCQAPTCNDATKNQNETDIDCGGGTCPTCTGGKACSVAGDCASGVCSGTPKVCQNPSCTDGVKNGTESDIDCGGTCATKCAAGKTCNSGLDCASGGCSGGVCLAAVCGDGVKSTGEGCDDHNTTSGDGCSAGCIVEFGFTCTGSPSVCTSSCGDGFKAANEGCDDHNTTNGDGCSSSCAVETGYTCTGVVNSVCTTTCGDGVKAASEGCDDGAKVNGDGCSSTCTVEAGYACVGQGPGSCAPICGNSQKHGGETCDDGNSTPGDGCDGSCHTEPGYICTGTGAGSCVPNCGDGQKVGAEACDDGNSVSGDGCSSTCTVEVGYTCTGTGAGSCTSSCGDGVKASNEGCDDHNSTNGDGCSSTCTIENGYTCIGTAPSVCSTSCGDGIKAGAEACDDHNTNNNDGCSSGCTVELGYTCTGQGAGSCTSSCGDGIKASNEACDDNNNNPSDGCSPTCTVEPGYTCVGTQPSVCSAGCGDGVKAGSEACDDGNNTSGDGCDSACNQEPGWTCTGQGPGSCTTTCGDSVTAGTEQCDDGNAVAGDGCNNCVAEPGWFCAGATCTPICGDSVKVGGETCDDGNAIAGDGCTATCAQETGWTCTGTGPGSCFANCGDGQKLGTEGCDDGNLLNNDGCSAGCTQEPGWVCTGQGPGSCTTTCGDGLKLGAEGCDDNNQTNGDGCSSACTVESGWACTGVAPSVCNGVCGDSQIKGTEKCDDGNTINGDGCSSTCQCEVGFECEPNNACGATVNPLPAFAGSPKTTAVKGNIVPASDLDFYSFTLTGPGVSTVRIETYFGTVGTCASTDANDTKIELRSATDCTSVLASNDDSIGYCSVIDGTSTSAAKNLAPGTYTVRVQASPLQTVVTPLVGYGLQVKIVSTCGDGTVVAATEACDDGNTVAGDGCSPTCTVETGYTCTGTAPSVCVSTCGNGTLNSGETCEDGNNVSGDGCAANTCTVEPGYTCTGIGPGSCVFTCGNSAITGNEKCDDGNTANGDGCSSTCQWEFTPEAEPNSLCGSANGPYALTTVGQQLRFSGSITPVADQDWFKFTIPNYADVRFETFDSTGPSTCASIDTVMDLYAADCSTLIKSQDQGGVGNCSRLDPTVEPLVRKMAPGTYAIKITEYLNDASINYSLTAQLVSLCGNGTVEGSEECDGGAGCNANCTLVPVCGNNLKQAGEQCDDGNTANGDGCSSTCQLEFTAEAESNGTCAMANGPYTIPQGAIGRLVSGSLTPPGTSSGDQDWFAFTVPVYADLTFQTFDSTGPGSCTPSTIDTQIAFYTTCGGTVVASNDTGGISNCSLLTSATTVGLRHLAPGTYYMLVNGFGSTAYSYTLQARFNAYCGDGIVEGSEQCDGGAGCGADCRWSTVAEIEPNGTTSEADANAVSNPLLLIDGNRNITGGISGSTDKDIFKMVVPANNTVVRLETFDSSGIDCRTASPFSMAGHALRILNSGGTAIVTDFESSSASGYTSSNTFQSGIGVCASLAYRLDAGTYYVQVDKTAALAAYVLTARFQTAVGNEVEPNDVYTSGTPVPGKYTQIFGGHLTESDTDFFAVTVPANGSIRAEIIEGDTSETCEANGIDSSIALFGPTGSSIMTSTGLDAGRGLCSMFDGTGASPTNSLAHNLAAGTYYIRVTSAGTTAGNLTYQFNYRLVVDIGY